MIFGLRFDCRNPAFAGVDTADRYRALLEMCEWADRRGGLFVGLSEHHGSDDDYLPSPLTVAAAIAAFLVSMPVAYRTRTSLICSRSERSSATSSSELQWSRVTPTGSAI